MVREFSSFKWNPRTVLLLVVFWKWIHQFKRVSKEYGHSESESRVRHYYCLKFFRIIASRELTVQLPNNNRNLYKLRKKTDLLESGHLSSTWYQYQEIRLTFSEYFRVWFIFTPINHVWGNCVIASMVFHGRDLYSGFWVKICGFLINISGAC